MENENLEKIAKDKYMPIFFVFLEEKYEKNGLICRRQEIKEKNKDILLNDLIKKVEDLENAFYCLCKEHKIELSACDFCGSKTKTSNFDNTNNITKNEMIGNNMNPQLYNLCFSHKICRVCREKK